MKKSSFISILCILALVALSGCSSLTGRIAGRGYENSPIYLDPGEKELERVAADVYRIQTSLRFRLGDSVSTVSAIGLATSLDEHHLLAAHHVVKIRSVQLITPIGSVEFQVPDDQKLEEETFVIFDDGSRMRLQVVHSDEEKDFALLRSEKKIDYFPFRVGNSDDLKIGDFVFLVGNFQTGLNIRAGYVTQLNFVRYGPKGEVSGINEDLFGFSAVTVEGDSGASIFLLRNGRLELGGMVTFLVSRARGLGFGVKINPIMNQIYKYLHDHEDRR